MKIVLELNAYHADSSACIFKDGVLIAAAKEEPIVCAHSEVSDCFQRTKMDV